MDKQDKIKAAQVRIVEELAGEWGLITAGTVDDFNTMTIAWGQTGTMWWKPVVTAYVVPTRHTHGYVNDNDYFTIQLFPEGYRDDLQLLGSRSGRDGDNHQHAPATCGSTGDERRHHHRRSFAGNRHGRGAHDYGWNAKRLFVARGAFDRPPCGAVSRLLWKALRLGPRNSLARPLEHPHPSSAPYAPRHVIGRM